MPNPFDRTAGAIVETIDIVDSELFCEKCGEATDHGTYVPGNKRLSYVCPNGHENTIRGIELD